MRRIVLLLTFVVVVVSGYLSFIGVVRQLDVPREKITPDTGFSYAIELQRSWAPGRLIVHPDSAEKPADSSLIVRENGRAISRAHSPLEDIRALGNGRLSHRGNTVYFATSDNSDPRENGRHYQFEYHRFTKKRIFFGACIALLLTLAGTDTVLASGWVAAIRRHPLFKAPHSYADAEWSPRRFVAHVFQYLGLYLVFVAAFSAWWSLESYDAPKPIAGGDQQLPNRFAYYKAHRDEFDLVFLGDSRTYCGIHPERIDPPLGSRSINLSSFTNWFPTQYAEAKQLAEIVPKGTTVVLTTGQVNFSCIGKIQRVFPIDIPTALRYSTMKIPREGLWDNVAYFNPYLHFWAIRGEIRESFLTWARTANTASLAVPTAELRVPPINPLVLSRSIKDRHELPAEVAEIVRNYGSDPQVTLVDLSEDGDRITSVIVYYRGGGYYRIEVDHEFFREKQQGAPRATDIVTTPTGTVTAPSPEPDCLGLFDLILEEFQRRGVKVIINEIEEAPYVYGSPEARRAFRDVMRTSVRPKVESRGFPYVTTDLDRLQDSDYFDYNHLNSNGIEKYAPMLAAALRPMLQGLEPEQP